MRTWIRWVACSAVVTMSGVAHAAQANQEWLILVFHEIGTGTDRYTVSQSMR